MVERIELTTQQANFLRALLSCYEPMEMLDDYGRGINSRKSAVERKIVNNILIKLHSKYITKK